MRRRGIVVLGLALLAGCGADPGPATVDVPGQARPVAVDVPSTRPATTTPSTTAKPPGGTSATVTETATASPVTPPPSTRPPAGAKEPVPHVDTYAQIASALHGDLCLDLEAAGKGDGVAVIQWPCDDTPQNRWGWADGYGQDLYKIVSRHSGKCVDVSGGVGAPVVQRTCRDSGGTQLWQRMYFTTANGWDYMRLKNVRSGLCLDVPNESDEWGEQLWQYDCHTGPAQQFRTPV